ncbi:MAG: TolC family protein [Deltaproteobacteria bacterium]|nr:TolC family protein [Deltaproteobacteria bacterium]
MRFFVLVMAAASASLGVSLASADAPESVTLDLARVIELASERSPSMQLARAQVAEAEARLAGADVRALENPTVGAALGPRIGPNNNVDVELSLEVPIERGGRRAKRVAAAGAAVAGEHLRVEETRRQTVAAAARSYYRALAARERVQVAREQKRLAEEMLGAAQARFEAGQVPQLEVSLARAEVARAGSQIAAEEVGSVRARTELALALGLPSTFDLSPVGELKDRRLFAVAGPGTPETRADVLASLADMKTADAEAALAETERLPDVALTLSYAREEDANVLLGGVSVSLPLFNPRKGAVLEAQARRDRARVEAETRKAAASAEIEGARESYRAAVEALRRLEEDALPLGLENERLTFESYRAGKIGLSTLLQVRREALEARRAHLDTLLDAAEAGTDLAAALGSLSMTTNTNPTH